VQPVTAPPIFWPFRDNLT